MTTTFEATVIGNDRSGYALNPNFGEHEGMTIADWKEQAEANGYTVTKNIELDGRIQNQQGTVYHCATAPDEYVDVCIWEETSTETLSHMARIMGRRGGLKGGLATTDAKRAASAANGAKGGRPRTTPAKE